MNFSFKQLFKSLINIIMPPLCGICREFIHAEGGLCASCMENVSYIMENDCQICGYPFDVPVGNNMVCGACLQNKPHFQRAYACICYAGTLKNLILRFKHADGTYLAPIITKMMTSMIRRRFIEADMIIPVPLSYKKHFKRHYNQSALIARLIAKDINVPFYSHILKRIKDNTQKDASKIMRMQAVKNSFICHPQAVQGKKVILIDDVMTTGATVNECSRMLIKAGAKSVIVVTFARVSLTIESDIIF